MISKFEENIDYVFNKEINLYDVNKYKGRPLLFIEDDGGYVKTITECDVERGTVRGMYTVMFSSLLNNCSTSLTPRETVLHVNCNEMVIRTLTETEFELYRRLTLKYRCGFSRLVPYGTLK